MPFDRQPVLSGRGVKLRPLEREDHDALYAAARDPLIWAQHPVSDRHRPEEFDRYFEDALRSGGALAILDSRDELIGSSRFHGYDPERREVEIGWTFLVRAHWGGTTNREVKRLMLEHALQSVDRVIFMVGVENYRSQRAVEKLGARWAGRRPDDSGQESFRYELERRDAGTLLNAPVG
jgi:RimJ/RimL family protein N-acetyltransferase